MLFMNIMPLVRFMALSRGETGRNCIAVGPVVAIVVIVMSSVEMAGGVVVFAIIIVAGIVRVDANAIVVIPRVVIVLVFRAAYEQWSNSNGAA
jgi:hypothetical protein